MDGLLLKIQRVNRFLRFGIKAGGPAAGTPVRCVLATRRVVPEGCTAMGAGNVDRDLFVRSLTLMAGFPLCRRPVATGEGWNVGSLGSGPLPIADASASAHQHLPVQAAQAPQGFVGTGIFGCGQVPETVWQTAADTATAWAYAGRPTGLRIAYRCLSERPP